MKLLGNRYELIEKIGSGGMADVYLAKDKELNRTVAIKILHSKYAADSVFIERFKREARSAANLSHPNIVSIYDWGKEEEGYYLVMEVLKGKTLKEEITQRGFLPEDEVINIVLQVCSALGYAHENNIIHRDIKPHNIVIDDLGHVKVTDFGIARIGDDDATVTQTGSMLGTPNYFSPEQAQGLYAGASSDIYSLGICMFELLTGKLPFAAEGTVAVAFKQVHEQPPSLRELNPDISEGMEKIVLKTLAKDPKNRYSDVKELAIDLKFLQRGILPEETLFIPPEEKINEPIPKQKKKPKYLLWIILAGFLLLATAVLGYNLYKINQLKKVAVPDVVGQHIDTATETLEEADLKVKIVAEENTTIPDENVISQDPPADSTVSIGSVVTLTVSSGKPLVSVPDVRGYDQATAANILGKAGLIVGEISYALNEAYNKDEVINQDPVYDSKVPEDTKVNLVLNKGVETVLVPSLIGLTRENAMKILSENGLRFSESLKYDDNIEAGKVIEQNPSTNEQVDKGSVVEIIVSKGPQKFSLPDLFGRPENVAINDLKKLGLEYKVVYENYDKYPEGTVVTQEPPKGTLITPGDKVTLVVAKKKEPSTSSVEQ